MELTISPAEGSGLADYLDGDYDLTYPEDREILRDWLSGSKYTPHRIIFPSGRYVRAGHTYVADWVSPEVGDGLRDSPRPGVKRGGANIFVPLLDLLDMLAAGQRVCVFPNADKRSVGECLP